YSNQEQRRNARPVVAAGGGLLVDNDELNSDWIEQHLIPLLQDRPRLAAMSAAAARFGHRYGDEMLREFVLAEVPRRSQAPRALATARPVSPRPPRPRLLSLPPSTT